MKKSKTTRMTMRAIIPPEIPPLFSLYSVMFPPPPVPPFPVESVLFLLLVSPPFPVVSVLSPPFFPVVSVLLPFVVSVLLPFVVSVLLLASHLGGHVSPMHSELPGPTHLSPFPDVSVLFLPSVLFVLPVVSVVFVFPEVSVVLVFVLFYLLQLGPSQTQAFPSSHVS